MTNISLLHFPETSISIATAKYSTQLHLVPGSRIVELYLHSPLLLDGIVLN
jgi:hypothetical protein